VAVKKFHGETMNFAVYGSRRIKLFIWLIGLVPLRIGTNIERLVELLRKHSDAINAKNGVIFVHVQRVYMSLRDYIKS